MIISSPAIVLQIRHWSQTSHIVTWLTPEYGKVVTSVKGACRPKSAFLGQYDLFYTCELLFYRREYDGIHAIRECRPLVLREFLRDSWRHAVAAGYLAELTARMVQSQQQAAQIYTLFSELLDRLLRVAAKDLVLVILEYEIKLLQLLGVQPDLATCPMCHGAAVEWLRFALPSGRFHCRHRSVSVGGEATVTLHREVRQLYMELGGDAPAKNVELAREWQEKVNFTNLVLGLSRFLGIFMSFHLEVPSAMRRVTYGMIETNHTA